MITDFLLSAVFTGIGALLSLMPTWTLPAGVTSIESNVVYEINGAVPIADMFTVLAAILGLRILLLGWDVVVWVYHQFWGSE